MGSLQNETSARSSFIHPRRAACTHMILTRVYGPYRCNHCNRTSPLGWVYHCSQDRSRHFYGAQDADERPIWNGLNKDLDGTNETSVSGTVDTDPQGANGDGCHVVQLSAWMEQAIQEGHYTPDQIVLLRAQKQQVNNIVQHEKNLAQIQPKLRSVSSSKPPSEVYRNLRLHYLTLYPSQDPPKSDLSQPLSDTSTRKDPPKSDESLPTRNISLKTPLFAPCLYKCCQTCRPSSRERAWQCLVNILESSLPTSLIDFSTDNRPISDVDILRRLDMNKKPPPMSNSDEMAINAINEQRYTTPNRKTPWPAQRIGEGALGLANQCIRNGAKRAFHGMLMSRRRPSKSSKSSRQSKRNKNLSEPEEMVDAYDLGLGPENAVDDSLSQAIRTRLPEDDETAWLDVHEEEVIVEDGVAVTEESIDLGTADIIMSV